jgi:hypothetical protein
MIRSSDAQSISIASLMGDPVAGSRPVRWAIDELRAALETRGLRVDIAELGDASDLGRPAVLVAAAGSPHAKRVLTRARVSIPSVPEALGLVPVESEEGRLLLACGTDERGLVYAVLDLADRVAHAPDPFAALWVDAPVVQQPANEVRSVARLFVSESDDKPWFHDKAFWRSYLSMIVAQRFNRLNLMVGLGYNFPWHITDSYLYFAYPFLVDVPGYGVRIPQLPSDERERNLQMLRFISDEAVGRGLDFQFGLWTHAYEWFDSPDARYTIEGLTPDNHAAYCRDALAALLEACPAIGGLTIRTHGESGIRERSWNFWKTVLDGPARSGRRVRIDLHSKGLDEETLQIALATGLPVTVSTKYAAEHMGLPYHQAAIRESERRTVWRDGRPVSEKDRFMLTSDGSRPFTRYGYGDFLREDRPYSVVFRIWPGTQRVLLWGDPRMAAGFGRHSSLAGCQGLEWCDPLSLKGREGTGLPGSRDGYADPSLSPIVDWEKYEYTYRLFGRLTYDPDSEPETWRRYLRTEFGPAAQDAEAALASASRILPLVTTAHHPSASNNYYWPEIYTDMPIVRADGSPEPYYYDSPTPKRFGTVSPLDPEIFSSVAGFVGELLDGTRSGRYSPLEVARWLERLSNDARQHLTRPQAQLETPTTPAARRLLVDVAIQEALGRFFAGKLRAATFYEIAARTGSRLPLRHALTAYRDALAGWTNAVASASGVYVEDLTFGPQAWLRGSWSDRLPEMQQDLQRLIALAGAESPRDKIRDSEARRVMAEAERKPPVVNATHSPPPSFGRGVPVPITLEFEPRIRTRIGSVRLRYRHVDQSEEYVEVELERERAGFRGAIPGEYTDSPYSLQYFFVLRDSDGAAGLYPGLEGDLSGQPYFVIRSEGHGEKRHVEARSQRTDRSGVTPGELRLQAHRNADPGAIERSNRCADARPDETSNDRSNVPCHASTHGRHNGGSNAERRVEALSIQRCHRCQHCIRHCLGTGAGLWLHLRRVFRDQQQPALRRQ